MILGSCRFFFHQRVQGDEAYQIIADVDTLAALAVGFIRGADIDCFDQVMHRVGGEAVQACVVLDPLNKLVQILMLFFL